MSPWKTRPALRLFAPARMHVGEAFVATLEVEATEAVDVEWIELTLDAVEGWSVGAGKNRVSRVHRYPKLVARVCEGAILAGTSRYEARFEIPATQPPSRGGGTAYVRYVVSAQASIPWWPDARQSWPITVRAASRPAEAQPVVIAPTASEHFEVSLESRRIATEGVVGGLLAVKKPWAQGPLVVDVMLREVLTLSSWTGFERVRHGAGFTTSVTLSPELGGKAAFKFSFGDVAPSFVAETFRHDWELVVGPRFGNFFSAVAGVFSDQGLRIPVELVESPSLAAVSPTLVPPSVGDSRLAELYAHVARLRPTWMANGLALERTLDSAFGPIEARVEWIAMESTTLLCATLEPPRLGLGLQVGVAGTFDGLFDDVKVGVADWDARHRVQAREPRQAVAFLAPIALADRTCSMFASDDSLVLRRPDRVVDAASLGSFVDDIDVVLERLATGLEAIPPPQGSSVDRTEAARIARLHHGTFHPGDLSLRGVLGEHAFESTLVLSGTLVLGQQVVVRPLPAGTLHVGPGRDVASMAAIPEHLRPVIASLPAAVTLAIEGGTGIVRIAGIPGQTFPVDHQRTVSLAGMLVMLARSFTPSRGAFR